MRQRASIRGARADWPCVRHPNDPSGPQGQCMKCEAYNFAEFGESAAGSYVMRPRPDQRSSPLLRSTEC